MDDRWRRVDRRRHGNPLPNVPSPNPYEGMRWIQQALVDFRSITNDTPCWDSFKCQQVVEKALKALVYTADSNISVIREHNLYALAWKACPSDRYLSPLIGSLYDILGRNCYVSTRYPDSVQVHDRRIPDEVYTYTNTAEARQLCSHILQIVEYLYVDLCEHIYGAPI